MRFSAMLSVALMACSSFTDASLSGRWGGQQASLVLQPSGGTVSYQCGAGSVDPGWSVSDDGQWSATGQHFFGGGPDPIGGRPPHPARYSGHLAGSQLTFTVTVTDLDEVLGPFHVTRDGPAVSEVCV